MNAYPNPTSGEVTIEFNSETDKKMNLLVMDIAGRIIRSEDIEAKEGFNTRRFDFGSIAKGVYLVRLNTSSGASDVLRLTIE